VGWVGAIDVIQASMRFSMALRVECVLVFQIIREPLG
jgi:hypothetical protein